jgi:hypothetical protein
MLDLLNLDELTGVCLHLQLHDLLRLAQTCKRLCHGEGGLETVELPTKSPVVTALLEHAFPGGQNITNTRPAGCLESWVTYLAGCAGQRRCRGAPRFSAGVFQGLFVDAAGGLLACGNGAAAGHGHENLVFSVPTPVAAIAGVRVRSVAAGSRHSLAISWDGRVYSWGKNNHEQLGHGDRRARHAPGLVEGLDSMCGVVSDSDHAHAVTQSGTVFSWGRALQPVQPRGKDALRPTVVEGFDRVRVRRVCASIGTVFAMGEAGELFSWGHGFYGQLGHGDEQLQPSPKRVEALRGVWVSAASVAWHHALGLAEDGRVYAWGKPGPIVLNDPLVTSALLPKPVEALRGVRVGSIAAGYFRATRWQTLARCGRGEIPS